ncbi:hypothetical protein ACIA8F_08930 [Streptomyces sp. NPDC051563]
MPGHRRRDGEVAPEMDARVQARFPSERAAGIHGADHVIDGGALEAG